MKIESIRTKVQPIVTKLSQSIILQSIMQGMMSMLPASMLGAFATLFKQIPITAYQNFITTTVISDLLTIVVNCTTNIVALIMVVGIANAFATALKVESKAVGFLAFVCFLILTPMNTTVNEWGISSTAIPTNYLGSQGIFSAIIVAMCVAWLYAFITKKGWRIKLPDSVPPFIQESFSAMVPGIIIGVIFVVIRALFNATSFGSIHAAIYAILQVPLQNIGGTIGALIIVILVTKTLWLFGIHGAMVTASIIAPVLMALDIANQSAAAAGQTIPNMIGYAFYNIYTIGGGTVALAICLLFTKSEKFKTLSKLCIVPAIFGISEPLMFGIPLVMNVSFAIPFVFSPIISIISAYLCTKIGLLPYLPGVNAPTGTPYILQGFIAGGWRVALFQAVMIVVLIFFWMPFVNRADKKELQLEKALETNKAE